MNSRIVLPLSLAFNLVCVVALFWRRQPPETTRLPAPDSPPATSAAIVEPQLPPSAPPARSPAFHWSQIESTNYFAYIANLRAIGCPEQTIRDIISADLRAAMKSAPDSRATEASIAHTDPIVNHLMHPDASPPPPVPMQETSTAVALLLSEPSQGNSLANVAPASAEVLERRRQMRFAVMQRTWAADSVRARYGSATLLDWQRQAASEGTSLDEFLQHHQIPLPSVQPRR